MNFPLLVLQLLLGIAIAIESTRVAGSGIGGACPMGIRSVIIGLILHHDVRTHIVCPFQDLGSDVG